MHNTLIAYKNSAFNISSAEFKTNMMKSYETQPNTTNNTIFSISYKHFYPFIFYMKNGYTLSGE